MIIILTAVLKIHWNPVNPVTNMSQKCVLIINLMAILKGIYRQFYRLGEVLFWLEESGHINDVHVAILMGGHKAGSTLTVVHWT